MNMLLSEEEQHYEDEGGIRAMAKKMPDIGDYKYGFHDKDVSDFPFETRFNKRNC